MHLIFQSSPSMQRETFHHRSERPYRHISILSLYAEGDLSQYHHKKSSFISILSLYAEGDAIERFKAFEQNISILSLYAEGDDLDPRYWTKAIISILSLYAEGDSVLINIKLCFNYFNPLPLCRGRHINNWYWRRCCRFQSSPSMQRETWW